MALKNSHDRGWETASSRGLSVLINRQFPGCIYHTNFKHKVENVLKRASVEWVFNAPWFKEVRCSAWSTTCSGTVYLLFYSLFPMWPSLVDSLSMFSFEAAVCSFTSSLKLLWSWGRFLHGNYSKRSHFHLHHACFAKENVLVWSSKRFSLTYSERIQMHVLFYIVVCSLYTWQVKK